MKIKHKETGKTIEVLEGTRYPEKVYELVDGKATKKATETEAKKKATESNTDKK